MPLAELNPGSTDPTAFDTSVLPDKIVVSEKLLKKKPGRPRYRDMAKNKKHGWYSDAKKLEVACVFAVTPNSRRVSELTNIPEATIRTWKQTEWWQEIMSRIHNEQNEELDAKLTQLVDKAVDQINDRLSDGDYVYNTKEDKLVRKPVTAKDLAIVTAITLDKRQLLRGQPTSRVEKVSENEKLSRLAEEFKKFSQAKTIENQVDLIEEELYDASQEGEIPEDNLAEYQDGNGSWETSETSHSNSDEQGEEDQEETEEEKLTINEMFSE